MRISTPMLLAGLATLAAVTKISVDAFFPTRPRLSWKLLMAPAAIAVSSASMQGQALDWSPITVTSDAGETTDAERTVITVPERHANPTGPTVRFPVVRFKSKAANPGTPLVYLAGGPGNAGTTAARRDQYFPGLMALRELSDVIVFDQRGTGSAEPSLGVDIRFDAPSDEPIESPKSRASLARIADSAARVVRARGVDLAAYNTQESADDIEVIRKAIGADKIALWGHSYGSHLGLAYIKRHGTHVSRAIFGGVNGLDQRWRYPSEGQAWLEAIDAATKTDPQLRALLPDFLGTIRESISKLEREPARVTVNGVTTLVGTDEIRTLMVLQGGESDFVKRLPTVVANLQKGEVGPYAPAVRAVLRGRQLGTVMSYVMHIASGVSPAQLQRIERETPKAILGDAINFPFSDPGFRNAWGVTDLGESFRSPVKSDIPVLFITGTLDGRTSVSAAKEVKSGFRNGTLITMNGAAHDIYAETPRLIELMTRFMRGERVRDTTIRIAVEFHGPDEAAVIDELHAIVLKDGAPAAIARAKAMRQRGSGKYLSSYVLVDLATRLDRTDKRPADAIAILKAATEIFPTTPLVFSRLGGLLVTAGDRAGAAAAFGRVVEINPLLRYSAVQLSKLK